jgi:phage baseplate assembly protein W
MPRNPNIYPYFGRGLKFPFTIDPATGGVICTEGSAESISVAIEYLQDYLTTGDLTELRTNHIAESLAHILLTSPGEWDNLPPFGSRIEFILFEPNNIETQTIFSVWMEQSTIRWEKRAYIAPGSEVWAATGQEIDEGHLGVKLPVTFITQQVPGNLVSPFVSARDVRNQEYPSQVKDNVIHDSISRYSENEMYTLGQITYSRLKKSCTIHTPRNDDIFHNVSHNDTWLLISYANYNDIRYWYFIAQFYLDDICETGSRSLLNTTGNPPIGELLRLPSRKRLLMELA